jgi:hypothetical protein
MEKFIESELRINKDVMKGDEESLLSLFNTAERFKQMEVLKDSEEDTVVKVVLDDLGETDLKLGADMERGRKKTIMTLFWFDERSKQIKMQRNAKANEKIKIVIWCK